MLTLCSSTSSTLVISFDTATWTIAANWFSVTKSNAANEGRSLGK